MFFIISTVVTPSAVFSLKNKIKINENRFAGWHGRIIKKRQFVSSEASLCLLLLPCGGHERARKRRRSFPLLMPLGDTGNVTFFDPVTFCTMKSHPESLPSHPSHHNLQKKTAQLLLFLKNSFYSGIFRTLATRSRLRSHSPLNAVNQPMCFGCLIAGKTNRDKYFYMCNLVFLTLFR